MKRASVLALFLLVPAVLVADSPRRSVIVATKHAATSRFHVQSLAVGIDPTTPDRNFTPFTIINGFAAELTDDEISALKNSSEVEYVEDVIERHAFGLTPASETDTIQAGQQTIPYGVTMVNAPRVWQITKGRSLDPNKLIHVAIIDTGIDYNHPELSAVYKGGHNFVANNEDPLDDEGHGTHVAGTIAAADDGAGVVGIASGVDVYSLKVLNQCGSGTNAAIISALQWVVDKKAAIGGNWIVNLSLGSDKGSTSEQTAFQHAADAGVLIFAASGNSYSGVDGLAYPAGYTSVNAVGAIDSTQAVANFSQRGADLKFVAPGVSVLSSVVAEQVSTNDGHRYSAILPVASDADGKPVSDICLSTPSLTGPYVFCGFGGTGEFPAAVNGKIALISRGNGITFLTKATNALAAGATGVIVYNNVPPDQTFGGPGFTATTLPNGSHTLPPVPPFVFISQADGEALKAAANVTVSMSFGYETYALESGTSMACPHAVGTAALVWAIAPSATAADITLTLEQTAQDLGDPGRDTTFGFGVPSAYHAAIRLNQAQFPVKARISGRRGH